MIYLRTRNEHKKGHGREDDERKQRNNYKTTDSNTSKAQKRNQELNLNILKLKTMFQFSFIQNWAAFG